MTPTPQKVEESSHEILQKSEPFDHPLLENEDIVISGMSGLYPKANNMKEFSDLLYSKTSPFSDPGSRWDMEHPELPQYVGKTSNVDTFDANFFTVNYRLAGYMDPMSRKLLEHTYQAIYDAGLSPEHLNGKKVAVFIGSSYSDSEGEDLFTKKSTGGLGIVGSSKTMYANRISYWLNIKGPSLSIDDGDCSSSVALEKACDVIKQGECEAAIVGGTHLCLLPNSQIHHSRIGEVSKDGKVKSYSENANGYILSDAINVLVLQKAKDALRCYAQILHVKNEYILSKDGASSNCTYNRNFENTAKFIKEFYKEVPVTPQAVGYVEGYGIGIPDADKSELEALAEVYCKERSNPLLIGSITSNIGLVEASAGIAGISKILLGFHKGQIAPSLNYEQPRKDVEALLDGRMRVVTEHQQFNCTYAAVNTMSVTGCNSHILLCRHYKAKNLSQYATSLPYLIPLSGRQESSVKNIFDDLKSRPLDAEEIALFHNIHSKDITSHLGRGYTILDTHEDKNTVCIIEKTDGFDGTKRQLWFVYSGMGSQWVGMGSKLMQIPIFAVAIKRCQRILAPLGLDIIDIITSTDKAIFDNILHSFVGITAIQIALTDVLKTLGLVPDGIIGHSVGELGCAYADSCLTAEETILAAYYRGKVSQTTDLVRGAMAAVGLGYKKISALCPPEIDVACRNSDKSCTISGPVDAIKTFVAQLTAKGIFTKEVQTANIAYHSRYIADAGPQLLQYLKTVIKNPKPRNKRWISTSVPQAKWNEQSAKYCSAEYLTNNLLNPVLFEEACQLIPPDAVLIEVAPHGLLQAVLKQSLPSSINISLTRRGHEDNVIHLLRALGDVYMAGFPINTQTLYPKVEFPVSTETPMLSHLVEWMHSEKWKVVTHNLGILKLAAICNFTKSIHDNDYKYLQGHVIKNKMCYPFAAAIVAAWDMYAIYAGLRKRTFPVIFKDIRLYAQPFLFDQKALRITVSLFRGTFQFEVRSEHSKVITGFITGNITPPGHVMSYNQNDRQNAREDLTSKSFYQLLNDRGYNYSGEFRSIEWTNASLTEAALTWCDNWVTFLDGLLQLNTLRQSHHTISRPTFIQYLSINVKEHFEYNIYELNGKCVIPVKINDDLDTTRSGGVLLRTIQYDKYLPEFNQNQKQINLQITSAVHNMKNTTKVEHDKFLTLSSKEVGKLDTLHWVQNQYLAKHNKTVTVMYAGLNKRDVNQITGTVIYDINQTYGMDYSGITNNGERIMGIVRSGSVSTKVDPQLELLWPVPNHWSLEDAATVPFAYAYAFYALVIKGSLQSGMNILIHEATEIVGQAAVRIALANKCQVFATVSDIRKKGFLQRLIPELQEENIGNSKDINFSDMVLLATQGNGCDIILSCVKGELKNVTLKCGACCGNIIDTSYIQDHEEFEFGLNHLFNCMSYTTVDFSSLFTENKIEDMKILQNIVSDGIDEGYVVPLSRVIYRGQEAKRAFKLLEKNQLAGRVILHISDNSMQAQHRTIYDPDKCQIIFWDDEVFGCKVAERLIKQGAKKLFINCTTLTPYQFFKIRSWEQRGVKVEVAHEEFTQDLTHAKILNEGFRLFGNIEGIYVILTKRRVEKEKLISAIEKLDSMSRLLCDQLMHFLVVSTVKDLGHNVCLSRAKLGLAATWLDLSSICHDEMIVGGNNIGDVVESVLCDEDVTFIAEINPVKPPTLFDELIAVADIAVPHLVVMTTTLQELNLVEEKISMIHTILKEKYNIYLERNEVPLLTLEKIREIEEYISSDIMPENSKGLSTFLGDTYSDEMLASVDLINLSTSSHGVIFIENDYNVKGQYLCIVPGIGGHYERFQLLCERLKLPAVVLQPGFDHPYETAKETAHKYAKILYKKTKIQDTFYILGYESGVMVALELAALLENQGLTGKVFCLGCAPSDFQKEVQYQLSEYVSEEQLQDAVIYHIYELLSGGKPEELSNKLRDFTSWAEKVDLCTRYLLGKMSHSAQFARALLETILARLVQAQRNTITVPKLRSKVILMRSASTLKPSDNTILQQLSEQPVAVHQLKLPLSSVTTDMACPALINEYLDETVLNAFENKNICVPYFIS